MYLRISFLLLLSACYFSAKSQISTDELSGKVNTLTSAVPFLTIAPDSRAGALGDLGVATSPDAASMHWNPAKFAFIENKMGVSLSYTPWLRALIPDINLSYLSGYYKLDDRQAIAASLRYFSLGNIMFTNIYGQPLRDYRPKEFAFDAAYSFKLSQNLSTAIAMRYIFSDLTGGIGQSESHAGKTIAGDVSLFYNNKDVSFMGSPGILSYGLNFSNIGGKISYTEDEKDFIPINLRTGVAYTTILDAYNSLTFSIDFNKLLIPTPPILVDDPNNPGSFDTIGSNPDISVPVAIFRSFYDAPGVLRSDSTRSVFTEETREIMISAGVEYWYTKQFAIRAGYFHEHETKGNRKFFTLGLGLKLNMFGLDFAYLVPTVQRHPLENTLRFTLTLDIAALKKEEDTK